MNKWLLIGIVCMLILSGCSGNSVRVKSSSTSSITDVLQAEVTAYEEIQQEELESLDFTDELVDETLSEEVAFAETDLSEALVDINGIGVDELSDVAESDFIDLTILDEDMVYAMVYQMMINPDDFRGKTIKMYGSFTSYYYEPNDKYYFAVLIEDALACCSSGIEFVWDDGSHIFPDEYPEEGQQVIVTGIYQTYKEGLDEATYVRLKDASMEVVE